MSKLKDGGNNGNIRLLSLDGGGIRGLSSLIILKHLLEQVNPKNPPKPCEYFQLIGGTSTGGLIALMLGRLHMSVEDCINKYMALSSAAFSLKRPKADITGRAKDKWKAGGKYSSESLANEFKAAAELLEGDPDALLLEPDGKCEVFVCTNSKTLNQPVLMRSYVAEHAVQSFSLAKCRLWEAARATSAATKFFDPMHIDMNDYVDGATGMNNPVELVLAEAKEIWADATDRIQCILSIGTGMSAPKDFGDNLLEVKDTLVALCTETERTEKRFYINQSDMGVDGRYFRFNVDRGLEGVHLDEHEKKPEIISATEVYLETPEIRDKVIAFTKAEAPQDATVSETLKSSYLSWLPYMDPLIQHNDARAHRRNKQTGDWFLRGHFEEWIAAEGSFIWLHAKAGSGKTVLSSSVIDELGKRRLGCLVFFYFTFQDKAKSSSNLLQLKYTLLTQLIKGLIAPNEKKPGYFFVPGAFKRLYEKYRPSNEPTMEDVNATIWQILPQSAATHIAIDGLDEYAFWYRKAVLEFLAETIQRSDGKVRVLVTSRDEPDIAKAVAKLPIPASVIPFPIDNVNHDIHKHLKDLVQVEPLSDWPHDLKDLVIEHLTENADGVFRWADLQMQTLAGKERAKDVRKALKKLPKGLEETYQRMLRRIDEADEAEEALTILKWLVCAKERLRLAEVAELAAFEVKGEIDTKNPDKDDFQVSFETSSRFKSFQPIRRMLSGLVSFSTPPMHEEGTTIVTFSHFSVEEYLQSETVSPLHFRLRMLECELFVYRCCIAYMDHYDALVEKGRSALTPPYPLLIYAIRWTWDHGKSALTLQRLQKTTVEPLPSFSPIFGLAKPLKECGSKTFHFLKSQTPSRVPGSAGEDIEPQTQSYYSFEQGKSGNPIDIVQYVLRNRPRTELAHVAAAAGVLEALQFSLDSGTDLASIDPKGQTLLHAAIMGGEYLKMDYVLEGLYATWGYGALPPSADTLAWLISSGCPCDVANESFQMPLHCAAEAMDGAAMQILLPHALKTINVQDVSGRTPLYLAISGGFLDRVNLLLQHTKCDVNLADERGRSPLMEAAQHGHSDIVTALLERDDIHLHARDNLGRSALFWAVYAGSRESFNAIFAALGKTGKVSIDDDHKDNEGWTPLICAAYMDRLQMIPLLIIAGSGINGVDLREKTALSWASFQGNLATVKELLDQPDVNINHADFLGRTALLWAAHQGHEGVVRLLLQREGINPACVDNYGLTWQAAAQGTGADRRMESLRDELQTYSIAPTAPAFEIDNYSFQTLSVQKLENQVWTIEFSHDGRRVSICGLYGTVEIWDIQSNVVSAKLRHGVSGLLRHGAPGFVSSCAWSPDDSMMVTCGWGFAKLWHVESQRLIQMVMELDDMGNCVWSPNGDWFVVGTTHGPYNIWQQFLNGPGFPWLHDKQVSHMTISPDGKQLIILDYYQNTYIYNTDTLELEHRIVDDSMGVFILASHNGRYRLSVHANNTVLLRDTATQETIQEYGGLTSEDCKLWACFGGLNESLVLSGSKDGSFYVWERDSARTIAGIEAHPPTCNCVAWSPVDPRLFASGGDDNQCKLWIMNKDKTVL